MNSKIAVGAVVVAVIVVAAAAVVLTQNGGDDGTDVPELRDTLYPGDYMSLSSVVKGSGVAVTSTLTVSAEDRPKPPLAFWKGKSFSIRVSRVHRASWGTS